MSTFIRFLFASLVSLFFLWLSFGDLDSVALLGAVRTLHADGVGMYLLALTLTQIARALRWRLLTVSFAKLSFRQAWEISNVGNLLIMMLPLRLGELSRPLMTKQVSQSTLSKGLGAAVFERVLDGLLVTLLFFAASLRLEEHQVMPTALMTGAKVALGIFVCATVFLTLALYSHGRLQRLVEKHVSPMFPTVAGRVLEVVDGFVQGLRGLPTTRAVVGVIVWTLVYWGASAVGMFWLMKAFDWHLPLLAGAITVCVLVVGVMIPAGPGLLGTYQAAIMAALLVFGIDKSQAATFSLVAYLGNVLVVVACGLPYLSKFYGKNRRKGADALGADGV